MPTNHEDAYAPTHVNAPMPTQVTGPVTVANGLLSYTVNSEYQKGPNRVDILAPSNIESGRTYPAVYVLPVAPGPDEDHNLWGDPRVVLSTDAALGGLNAADRFDAFFVFPVFDTLPWYGDSAANPLVRQESYMLNVVLPLIETRYPVRAGASSRLLAGFSKSGWGAFSLLLRHPDLFGRAAAWDSPMMLARPGPYGSGEVFADQANFDHYAIPGLLRHRSGDLGAESRLILMGYSGTRNGPGFRSDTERLHALMLELGVSHEYRDGPQRAHHWATGWLPEALDMLLQPRSYDAPSVRLDAVHASPEEAGE